jgi:hypothetical protein
MDECKSDEILVRLDFYISKFEQIASQATNAAAGLKKLQLECSDYIDFVRKDANSQ